MSHPRVHHPRLPFLLRHAHPEPELQLLLERLKLELPARPPPRVTIESARKEVAM